MLKRGTMQKAFIDMANEKTAQAAIDDLDNYDFIGQNLEVRFSDPEQAQQYPKSKKFRDSKRDSNYK
jgi:RNA recognition motif-containing protein